MSHVACFSRGYSPTSCMLLFVRACRFFVVVKVLFFCRGLKVFCRCHDFVCLLWLQCSLYGSTETIFLKRTLKRDPNLQNYLDASSPTHGCAGAQSVGLGGVSADKYGLGAGEEAPRRCGGEHVPESPIPLND